MSLCVLNYRRPIAASFVMKHEVVSQWSRSRRAGWLAGAAILSTACGHVLGRDCVESPCPGPFDVFSGYCNQNGSPAPACLVNGSPYAGTLDAHQTVAISLGAELPLYDLYLIPSTTSDPTLFTASLDGQPGTRWPTPPDGVLSGTVIRWLPFPPNPQQLAITYDGDGTEIGLVTRLIDYECETQNPRKTCPL